MDATFLSESLPLACYLRVPPRLGNGDAESGDRAPIDGADSDTALILCHGFPTGPLDARRSAGTYPELVDRIVRQVGIPAMAFNFRGCGTSAGDFSLQGWVADLRAAIEHAVTTFGVSQIVLVGTNTGGSIAVCVGADDPRIRAVAMLGSRADFDDWADHPRRFLEHARRIGAVRSPNFPSSMDEWSREFRRFRPLAAAHRFAPRPALVMHGDADEIVPTTDSRQLAEAHGAAELSVLEGAGHRLRHDPRAVAILLGWIERVL